jgi:hypothetical protein
VSRDTKKIRKSTARCDFLVKPLPWRGQRGLGLRLKPLLMKKGLGLMEDGRGIPALKLSLIKGL